MFKDTPAAEPAQALAELFPRPAGSGREVTALAGYHGITFAIPVTPARRGNPRNVSTG